MNARTLLFLCVGLVAIVSLGVAQESWNITGAGARAEGLGGAFIGVADDATAISWNPSGLGQLERTELSLVGRWIQEEYKWENPLDPKNNSTRTQSHLTYNFASIAFPLHAGKINIVPAVAFQKQLDNYAREDDATSSYESNGGANTITPGIGLKLHPMFYVGGAVNIWLGSSDNSTVTNKSTNAGNSNEATYSGLNFTAGFLVDFEGMKKPIPIKLGATVKTPFELKVDGTYERKPAGTTTTKGVFVNTVEMPLMYGFGASGRIGENLTIAVDFESRLYGDKKIFFETDGNNPSAAYRDTANLSDSKSDLNQVRLGAEYLLVTTAGVIPIRAGFRTVPTLSANVDDKGKYSDMVMGNAFTLGTGFIGQSLALDLTYTRGLGEQSYAQAGGAAKRTLTVQTVSASLIVYF
jgi:hypothetical protein